MYSLCNIYTNTFYDMISKKNERRFENKLVYIELLEASI